MSATQKLSGFFDCAQNDGFVGRGMKGRQTLSVSAYVASPSALMESPLRGWLERLMKDRDVLKSVPSDAERDANVCGAPDSIPSAAEAAFIGMD